VIAGYDGGGFPEPLLFARFVRVSRTLVLIGGRRSTICQRVTAVGSGTAAASAAVLLSLLICRSAGLSTVTVHVVERRREPPTPATRRSRLRRFAGYRERTSSSATICRPREVSLPPFAAYAGRRCRTSRAVALRLSSRRERLTTRLGSSPSGMLIGRLAPIGTPTERTCPKRTEFSICGAGRH